MKKRLVDADKLMERAKMNSVLVTVEHDHHDYGMTLGALNKIVKECELPPAQPKRTEKHACDLISRQMLLEYIHGEPVGKLLCDKYNLDGLIEQFPSAQPERKTGKWEIYVISMFDGEGCRCSECGLEGVPYWDFCPNCGANMREVSE